MNKSLKIFEYFAQHWGGRSDFGCCGPGNPAVWIVGFSGGLDSTVLLDLCWRYRQEIDGSQTIVAAHLNHGLRGKDADDDEAFCQRFCEEHGIAFRVKKMDVRSLAAGRKIGVEEAGRFARRIFFEEVCIAYGDMPAYILLGHHADDQAETVFMNILRGTGLRGLAGMADCVRLSEKHGRKALVCRPLLAFRKEDLRAYALSRGLVWREDLSNDDPSFLRNRLRREVLPLLENLRPNFSWRLCSLANAARAATSALAAQGEALWRACRETTADGILLRMDSAPPLAILAEAVNFSCQHDFGAKRLQAVDYATLGRVMAAAAVGGRLANGLFLKRSPRGIMLMRSATHPQITNGELLLPPDTPFAIEGLGVRVAAETRLLSAAEAEAAIPASERHDRYIGWFDAERLSWPLRLRIRRSGDRFHPLGAPGSRKIKKILCDAKMDMSQRDGVRLLCDQEGIIWLWPWRIGHRCRITAATKIALRIHIAPLV